MGTRYTLLLLFLYYCTPTIGQSFESFDNTRIAYTDQGTGIPIILIHGFINTGASFNGTALKNALLESGYRVIIPDLRGNGNSEKSMIESAYANNAEVKDLSALLDHLNISKAIALGYSRGSIILAKWLTLDSRITKGIIGGMGIDFTKSNWERRIIFERAFLGLDSLTDMTRGAFNYARSHQANTTILGWSQRYQPVTTLKELSSITIPIAVIAGNEDLDNGDPGALFKAFSNGVLIIVKGDHNTTYRKQPFAKAVLKFLNH